MNEVEKRFYEHLSPRPRASDDKKGPWLIMAKEQAIEYKFLQLPNQKRKYICLDLDYELAGSQWMWIDMLQPTIIISNPKNSHAKYLFELSTPVLFPLSNGQRASWISQRAIDFYHGVKRGLDQVLNGDIGYTGNNINNPLHPYWKTYFLDMTYSLDEIAEYIPYTHKVYVHKKDDIYEGREKLMFNHCRKALYPQVKNYKNYSDWKVAVENCVLDFYHNTAKLIQSDHELSITEAYGVIKSLTTWIWNKKDDSNFKQYMYNRGVMKNKPIKKDLSEEDLVLERKRRQSLGAKYVNDKRRLETERRISVAIELLKNKNLKITKTAISKETGLSMSYLNKFKQLINSSK